ncbi:hypothetical protein KAU45_00770 [bacterium]|nr:hypothetical protein [bacterium]
MPRKPFIGVLAGLALLFAGCGAIRDVHDIEVCKNKALIGDREYLFELAESLDYLDDPNLRLAVVELAHLGEDGLDCLYHILLQTPDETMQSAVRRELEASPSDRAARLLAEYDTGEGAFAWDLRWETPRGAKVVSGEVVEVNVFAQDNASLMLLTDGGRHVHCHFTGHTNELLYIKSELVKGRVRVSVGGSSSYIE